MDANGPKRPLQFQFTPSARRATPPPHDQLGRLSISIHALREESDCSQDSSMCWYFEFQSTPSARRATGSCFPCHRMPNISIHALREESDKQARSS